LQWRQREAYMRIMEIQKGQDNQCREP
jgi:hypothetical protein